MTGDQFGETLYLAILGGAVLIWFIAQNRLSLGKMVQQGLAWVLIFVAVLAGIGVWDDIRSTIQPQQSVHTDAGQIVVPRSRDGHYYLTLDVNGEAVRFLVDTGASQMVLSSDDAEKAGIDMNALIFSGRANTANGQVSTAPVWLERVGLGPYEDQGLRAWVNGGELNKSLLGMGYLQLWSGIEIRDGSMILTR